MLHSHFRRRHRLTSFTARFIRRARKFAISLCTIAFLLLGSLAVAQELAPDQMKGLSWRLIGPFRGGDVAPGACIPGAPPANYLRSPGRRVLKTHKPGLNLHPRFYAAHLASIAPLL